MNVAITNAMVTAASAVTFSAGPRTPCLRVKRQRENFLRRAALISPQQLLPKNAPLDPEPRSGVQVRRISGRGTPPPPANRPNGSRRKEHAVTGVSIQVIDELTGQTQSMTYACHSPQRLAQIVNATTSALAPGQTITAIAVA